MLANAILIMTSYLLSMIFFMSTLDKVRNWKINISKLEAYKLLSKKYLPYVYVTFLIVEMGLTYFFITIQLNLIIIMLFFLLLLIYSTAIIINLYRGNTLISCGCGGVLEKEQLTFSIVIRNFTLMIIGLTAFLFMDYVSSFTYNNVLYFLTALSILILYGIYSTFSNNIQSVIKLRKKLSHFAE